MDRLDFDTVVTRSSSKNSSKKRKWREIEAIMEEKRLARELQMIENCFDVAEEHFN